MSIQPGKLREVLHGYGALPLDKQFEEFRKNPDRLEKMIKQVEELIGKNPKQFPQTFKSLCKNHAERPCRYGKDCYFAHSYAVQRAAMRIFKNPTYKREICKKGAECLFEKAKRCHFIHKDDPEHPPSQRMRTKRRQAPSIHSSDFPAPIDERPLELSQIDSPLEKQENGSDRGDADSPISFLTQPSTHLETPEEKTFSESNQPHTPHFFQSSDPEERDPFMLPPSAFIRYQQSLDYLRDLDGDPSFFRLQLREARRAPAEFARRIQLISRAIFFGREPLPTETWKSRLCDSVTLNTPHCPKGQECEDAHSLAFFYARGSQVAGGAFKTEQCPTQGTNCDVNSCPYTHQAESFLFSDDFLNGGAPVRVATISSRPQT